MATTTLTAAQRRVNDSAARSRRAHSDIRTLTDGWKPCVKREARKQARYSARDEIELALLEMAEAS